MKVSLPSQPPIEIGPGIGRGRRDDVRVVALHPAGGDRVDSAVAHGRAPAGKRASREGEEIGPGGSGDFELVVRSRAVVDHLGSLDQGLDGVDVVAGAAGERVAACTGIARERVVTTAALNVGRNDSGPGQPVGAGTANQRGRYQIRKGPPRSCRSNRSSSLQSPRRRRSRSRRSTQGDLRSESLPLILRPPLTQSS
jgi:hypothetical protein